MRLCSVRACLGGLLHQGNYAKWLSRGGKAFGCWRPRGEPGRIRAELTSHGGTHFCLDYPRLCESQGQPPEPRITTRGSRSFLPLRLHTETRAGFVLCVCVLLVAYSPGFRLLVLVLPDVCVCGLRSVCCLVSHILECRSQSL